MKTWQRYSGLILPVLVVAALVLWPAISGKAANRESAFTILKAIADRDSAVAAQLVRTHIESFYRANGVIGTPLGP